MNESDHFTGDEHDAETGLEHTLFRQMSGTEGRWLSPDPYMGSMDIGNPQSLNRYAYVKNSPSVFVDPKGLCDVVIGGITQSSTGAGSAAETTFANQIGANLVFPYVGGSVPGGGVDVVTQGFGIPGADTGAVVAAITAAAKDSGPINVFAYSGGAQAFATAISYLPTSITSRINNVTYLSPGTGILSDLPRGNGVTIGILNRNGITDNVIGGLSTVSLEGPGHNCSHTDTNCIFTQHASLLTSQAGSTCSKPATFSRGGGGGAAEGLGSLFGGPGGWYSDIVNFVNWVASIPVGPVEVVTHEIIF